MRTAVWCSGVTVCQAEDNTFVSRRGDNGAPVVTGTEECEGRRREGE